MPRAMMFCAIRDRLRLVPVVVLWSFFHHMYANDVGSATMHPPSEDAVVDSSPATGRMEIRAASGESAGDLSMRSDRSTVHIWRVDDRGPDYDAADDIPVPRSVCPTVALRHVARSRLYGVPTEPLP